MFQGADMNNVVAGPVSIPPDMMPSLEDFMVVLCIVLLDYVVYPIVRRRTGRPVTSLSKMTAGMFCMAIGFFVTGFLQLKIDAAPRAWVAACTPAVAITLVCALWAGGGGLRSKQRVDRVAGAAGAAPCVLGGVRGPRAYRAVMPARPQYFFIAAGEVLVSVPGLEFAYSQV